MILWTVFSSQLRQLPHANGFRFDCTCPSAGQRRDWEGKSTTYTRKETRDKSKCDPEENRGAIPL